MEGFQINYTDLSDLFWEYKRKIENLIENIDNCIEKINMFTENAVFTGKTGDAVKSYLGEAHITILSGIKVTAQTLLDNMAAYKDGYRAIDSSTNFKLDEEAIQEFRKKLASNYEDTDEYTGKIRSALSEVSDISDVGMPDSNGVFDIHEQMDSDLIKLVSNVNSYERENVVRLENSVELLLENLQSCLSKIGLSQGAIESYETGSFITGKDAGALNTGIKIFGDLHEKNKEAYDEIYETEQKIKDEAEKRKTQGIWRTVGGAVLIATGAACIVLTGGAAIPIVADVAVAVGSGTAVFGAADAIEGTQDIYYGSTGDIDSTAVNGIKDDLFQGNEDAYYLTENAFAFAASAMIPIGHASTAGNLTFKSTATIVAKEGISMGAGAGAQKITTDVTGNDTAGMVAGMVASGVTAKGLNGIEAEANKLAKPKLGDVGDGGDAVLNDADGPVVKEGSIEQLSEIEYKELTGYEYLDTQLGNLKDKVKLNQYQSAESVNDWWANNGYDRPPYTPKTVVQDITLDCDTIFVRVYDGNISGLRGGWVMCAEDIKGLTPEQIQQKFALPSTPKYIGEVKLKAGSNIRMGEVNHNYGFNGGGIQFDLKGQYIGEFKEIGSLVDWSMGK
ncbi:T7SS effector LXG polymorphic toxin [Agathobacter rectalis]|uniref:T7SS effector LXG polymorphic toxin n=1 Tax=Agathobacter rectalis TaxID=39491 RepID=UPI0027D22426|nr:T7SS effector LXG polymorphic toxin [Agathobacter rectalis]